MNPFPQKIALPKMLSIQKSQNIIAGNFHSYSLTNQGIYVWGNNSNSILGIQQTQSIIYTPKFIPMKINHISTGAKHTFAYNKSQVYGWGSNLNFQLGLPEQKYYPITKIKIFEQANSENFILNKISCGQTHSLAIIQIQKQQTFSKRLFAWGNSKSKQLTVDSSLIIPYPILCQFDSQVDYNITITDQQQIYSWGTNFFGRLGLIGVGVSKTQRIPKKINLEKIVQIGIGEHHVVAINKNGEGFSWGHGLFGQLGIGILSTQSLPNKILINEFLKQAACGEHHTILLTQNGDIYSCGSNSFSCLGHEESLDEKKRSLIPRKIVNIEKIIKISTGNKHNLALSANKKVYSWGDNSFGQLGIQNLATKQIELNDKINQRNIKDIKKQQKKQITKQKKLILIEEWHRKYRQFLHRKSKQQQQMLKQLQDLLKQ